MERQIVEVLASHGAHCFGVCRFADLPPLLPCRAQSRLPGDARSVIVVALPYYTGPMEQRNVARYAVLPDYHQVAGAVLDHLAQTMAARWAEHRFVPFVDNSPVPEVEAANLAGLGVIGRHGQLIHPLYGGHVFLGAVVTTLELAPSRPLAGSCLGCGKCITACPTGALSRDGFAVGRCRSHITQKKGDLTPWEREQIRDGGLAWGCDICVDVCPMNTWRLSPVRAFYQRPAPVLTAENLPALLKEKPYGYRGRAVLERNLHLIRS